VVEPAGWRRPLREARAPVDLPLPQSAYLDERGLRLKRPRRTFPAHDRLVRIAKDEAAHGADRRRVHGVEAPTHQLAEL
jgi:hypothetical protein